MQPSKRFNVATVLKLKGQRLGKSTARLASAGRLRKIVLKRDRSVRRKAVVLRR